MFIASGAPVVPGWTVNAGAEGTDTLVGIEKIDNPSGGDILLVARRGCGAAEGSDEIKSCERRAPEEQQRRMRTMRKWFERRYACG